MYQEPTPHLATHSTLLARNTQKPALRRHALRDATSHEAASVTTIAGHCMKSNQSMHRMVRRRARCDCSTPHTQAPGMGSITGKCSAR